MKCLLKLTAALAVLSFGGVVPLANADIRELRLGVVKHNVLDHHNREQSENIEGEIVFDSPKFLSIIGAPRPYVMGSINDQGFTSFGAVGLYWRYQFSEHWAIEPGFGYAIHNGKIDIPYPEGDPRNAGYGDDRVLLGSRDLFRDTIALERNFGDHFATQAYFEHLSHGQIIGSGRNQGLDEVGVRMIVRFKPAK